MKEERANFGSKFGMILATAGGAVGLGNVWRFPYMTGENGGAAFILIYMICVLLLGIPCMISEFIIGRHGASNTYRAYSRIGKGSAWKYVGLLGVMTGFLITGYYGVVAGWCLEYVYASAIGDLHGSPEQIQHYFEAFSGNPLKPIFWLAMILLVTHYVVIHGVRGGIERASKWMMPILFVLLLVIAVCACMLPGAQKGISFLFHPDFSKFSPNVFLDALGQSFYSLSIAMGCICTYASYYSRKTNLVNSAFQVAAVDSLIAILAGLMIFPAAFSVGVNPDSGASLIFITLPNVFSMAFAGMPVLYWIISFLFYLLLSLAAITSLMSLHEVSTSFFFEEFHLSRRTGAAIVTVTTFLIGAVCSMSLGHFDWLVWGDKNVFEWFDFITGQIFLPIGGFLTCVFLGWFVPMKVVKDEFTNWGTHNRYFFTIYLFLVRYVCPISIVCIFLHQLKIF